MRSLFTGIQVDRRIVAAVLAGVVCGAASVPVTASVAAAGFLVPSGAAVGWGFNHDGQLGDGTVAPQAQPVPVQGLSSGVARLAAGDRHSLAVGADGTVRSWGLNGHGQLGDGTTTPHLTPAPVLGLTDAVQVSAGSAHSVALRSDGSVWTWGANFSGQLGTGAAPAAHSAKPEKVLGLDGILQVVARQNHTLALRFDGTVWGWGANTFGELGDGNTGGVRHTPVKVVNAPPFVRVATGPSHSMALTADGFAFAWGRNDGRLGNGQLTPNRPSPVPVPGLVQVRQLAAGSHHSAAVMADGTVRTWGSNQFGQLGDPDVAATSVRTAPGPVPDLTGVTDLAAGHFHNLALRSGELWGWGDAGLWPTPLPAPVVNGVLVRATPIPHIQDAISVAAGVRTSLVVVTASPALDRRQMTRRR